MSLKKGVLFLTLLAVGICFISIKASAQITFTTHEVDNSINGAAAARAADIDNDGDYDIVGAGKTAGSISWYENDGEENFTERVVTNNFPWVNSIDVIDVDDDGDIDVVATSGDGSIIVWFENEGENDFDFERHELAVEFGGAYYVDAIDLDEDGDVDVVAAALTEDRVSWFENDGNLTWTERVIHAGADGAANVKVVDFDEDGDLDVVAAIRYAHDIVWCENDGNESFTVHTVENEFGECVFIEVANVDGVNGLDIVASSLSLNEIAWYENDGGFNFSKNTITDAEVMPWAVRAVDMDLDGDIDILTSSLNTSDITYWENDGGENFTEHDIEDEFQGGIDVYPFDIDEDGDFDVIGCAVVDDKITLWENQSIPDIPVVEVGYPNDGEVFNYDSTETITWMVDTYGEIDHCDVEYSMDGGSTWHDIGTTQDDDYDIEWVVPENYGIYAVVRVTAVDTKGGAGYDVSDDWFTICPGALTYEFYRGWTFFGLPFIPGDNTRETLIEAGVIDDQPWDLFGFEMESGHYRPEELFCGKGYKLSLYQDTLTTTFTCTSYSEQVVMDLDWGWNYIGNPFYTDLDMADLEFRYRDETYGIHSAADRLFCIPAFYTWFADDSVYVTHDPVEVWTGYWFVSLVEDAALLVVPPAPGPVPTAADEPLGTPEAWELNFTAAFDGKTDRLAGIGANMNATDGFDPRFDLPEPPMEVIGNAVNAYFREPEWLPNLAQKFCKDIREQMIEEDDVWELFISTAEAGEVTLTWDDIFETTPTGYEFEIYDPTAEIAVNPRAQGSYSFHCDGEYRLTISVHASLGAGDVKTLPADHALLEAYPNPFNAVVNLSYSVLQDGLITVKVYDVKGGLVETLADERTKAGGYRLSWNAEGIPDGIYVVRLETQLGVHSRKILLIK